MFGHCTALNCTLTAAADINKMRCFCTEVFGCKGGTNRAPVPEDDANADGINPDANSDANADQDAIVLPSDDEGAIVIPSDDAGVASMMALVEVLPTDLRRLLGCSSCTDAGIRRLPRFIRRERNEEYYTHGVPSESVASCGREGDEQESGANGLDVGEPDRVEVERMIVKMVFVFLMMCAVFR